MIMVVFCVFFWILVVLVCGLLLMMVLYCLCGVDLIKVLKLCEFVSGGRLFLWLLLILILVVFICRVIRFSFGLCVFFVVISSGVSVYFIFLIGNLVIFRLRFLFRVCCSMVSGFCRVLWIFVLVCLRVVC